MKKAIAIFLSALLVTAAILPTSYAARDEQDAVVHLSEIVRENSSDSFFGSLAVTIGETSIFKDGEEIPIDDAGTAAYIENDKTMLPVRVIAEEIGADVTWDAQTRSVTVSDAENTVELSIGSTEMQVNGETVTLQAAPEITNNRTMLPARDVAEALDCEVSWDGALKTATITKPLQTKRIIAFSDQADTAGAADIVRLYGMVVMQFDTIAAAQACMDRNAERGIEAEPDYVRTSAAYSWGADAIGGDTYYRQTGATSGSAIVAVIDTGIDNTHPMFTDRLVAGYDLYNNDSVCEDLRGHGTHVSGTIVDIAGSNPRIKIMPVKVFGAENRTSSSMVVSAIRYAADHGANVMNLSLGGPYTSHAEELAVQYALTKNIAVVAAAGNDGLDLRYREFTPAKIDGVITVSSCNRDGSLSYFSNYGEGIIDFAAPGNGIVSANVGGGTISRDGTSMAAPHVSAVYALAMAVHPEKAVNEITAALKQNATPAGSASTHGAGIIRAADLESYLAPPQNTPDPAPDFSVSGTVSIPSPYKGLNVRSGPSTSYSIVGDLSQGETCAVYPKKTQNDWYYVTHNGVSGYAYGPYIQLEGNAEIGTVTGLPRDSGGLNIRSGPSTSYDVLGYMPPNAKCVVYPEKTQNGWFFVQYEGISGYSAGTYIKA